MAEDFFLFEGLTPWFRGQIPTITLWVIKSITCAIPHNSNRALGSKTNGQDFLAFNYLSDVVQAADRANATDTVNTASAAASCVEAADHVKGRARGLGGAAGTGGGRGEIRGKAGKAGRRGGK